MKINIHLGVHKTATTYIQNTLHHNRAALREAGIGYINLWEFRGLITDHLMAFSAADFKIEDLLPKFFGGQVPAEIRGLVISEENLIGYCGGLLNSGLPYEHARQRLEQLRALLAGHELTMFCAIREYGSFLSSAYCEGIRNTRHFIRFEAYRNRLGWAKLQWPYLINRFEEALAPDRTVLWCYEDFRRNAARIIDALTFDAGLAMAPPTGRNAEYPSFSKTTVDTLVAIAAAVGGTAANALIKPVADAFPKGEAYPGFEPWSAKEAKLLQAMYDADCREIPAAKWLMDEETRWPFSKAA